MVVDGTGRSETKQRTDGRIEPCEALSRGKDSSRPGYRAGGAIFTWRNSWILAGNFRNPYTISVEAILCHKLFKMDSKPKIVSLLELFF